MTEERVQINVTVDVEPFRAAMDQLIDHLVVLDQTTVPDIGVGQSCENHGCRSGFADCWALDGRDCCDHCTDRGWVTAHEVQLTCVDPVYPLDR